MDTASSRLRAPGEAQAVLERDRDLTQNWGLQDSVECEYSQAEQMVRLSKRAALTAAKLQEEALLAPVLFNPEGDFNKYGLGGMYSLPPVPGATEPLEQSWRLEGLEEA
jgi:hypothetical protein